MGQSDGAGRWRVCYQRGLPRLVYFATQEKVIYQRKKAEASQSYAQGPW